MEHILLFDLQVAILLICYIEKVLGDRTSGRVSSSVDKAADALFHADEQVFVNGICLEQYHQYSKQSCLRKVKDLPASWKYEDFLHEKSTTSIPKYYQPSKAVITKIENKKQSNKRIIIKGSKKQRKMRKRKKAVKKKKKS